MVYGPDASEVIVIDNQSVDGSVAMLNEKFKEVITIANQENTGFSRANNQGIKISKGEYVLLLNPDTLVQNDTFLKTVKFMDENPAAGGLGVKMVDGKGNFLPESKRGLPTPEVAFYKIFGLAALFPNSKRFGKYHLTYLDKNKNHEVEILAGAFMLMRKSALDKVGLLDEDFFMYGEDIDLSYRIILGGYKNFYFSDTQIIHYKGESTKKSSVNYVFVFYNAMIIFAKKHFSAQNAALLSILIRLAIYLRAGIAITNRFIKKISSPLLDFLMLYAAMRLLTHYWEVNHKSMEGVTYPPLFLYVFLPGYILIWLSGLRFYGAYDAKRSIVNPILKGVLASTAFILVVYSLLNEDFRFSRALIVFGALISFLVLVTIRILARIISKRTINLEADSAKKTIIVADEKEYERIKNLISQTSIQTNVLGRINPDPGETGKDCLGSTQKLADLTSVYKTDEIIFSSKNLAVSDIISFMTDINQPRIEYKIAPPESVFIIGSNSVNTQGELYLLEMNTIEKSANRRNKRLFDIAVSIILLIFSPLLVFANKKPLNFIANIFQVLVGKKSWVGFSNKYDLHLKLPKIKPGILSSADLIESENFDVNTYVNLDLLYAKNYSVDEDLQILLKNLNKLDKKV